MENVKDCNVTLDLLRLTEMKLNLFIVFFN
jgi:hypothetical protein